MYNYTDVFFICLTLKSAITYKCRRVIVKIFQLHDRKSENAHHMFGVNWLKNFSHCSISGSVAPSSMQKLCTPLATIFVEKKIWKKFWCGFRPIQVTSWKEFLISWKKWRFEIFRTTAPSRASDPWIDLSNRPTSLFMNDSRLGIGALIGSMNSLKITPEPRPEK